MDGFPERSGGRPPTKEVYVIVDRSPGQKAVWIRVGAAWENRDGSLQVVLDALPVEGRLHIRDPKPKTEEPPHRLAARAA